jgi:hypothetical protein
VPPLSVEELAMRLQDLFWGGLTLESGIQCSPCNVSELRVLVDTSAEQLVRACDWCSWACTAQHQEQLDSAGVYGVSGTSVAWDGMTHAAEFADYCVSGDTLISQEPGSLQHVVLRNADPPL